MTMDDEAYERGEVYLTQEVLDAREELGWEEDPLPSSKEWTNPKSEMEKSMELAKRITDDPVEQAKIASFDLILNQICRR